MVAAGLQAHFAKRDRYAARSAYFLTITAPGDMPHCGNVKHLRRGRGCVADGADPSVLNVHARRRSLPSRCSWLAPVTDEEVFASDSGWSAWRVGSRRSEGTGPVRVCEGSRRPKEGCTSFPLFDHVAGRWFVLSEQQGVSESAIAMASGTLPTSRLSSLVVAVRSWEASLATWPSTYPTLLTNGLMFPGGMRRTIRVRVGFVLGVAQVDGERQCVESEQRGAAERAEGTGRQAPKAPERRHPRYSMPRHCLFHH